MNEKEILNEVLQEAVVDIKNRKGKYKLQVIAMFCITAILVTSIICGSVIALGTIREQQYALNMQYASLMEYVANAEISTTTTETIDSGGGGVAAKIEGDNNTIGGE